MFEAISEKVQFEVADAKRLRDEEGYKIDVHMLAHILADKSGLAVYNFVVGELTKK
jgi:hypothetical protein